uniref:Hydroxysteroid dehydrogenase-like protein 2 n=1 Tax=Panagrolaimus superbus TaxID=310955 RepID=A0A914YJ22_9BILA
MHNTGKFAGKTILITGASRGIGKAVALKLAKDGANIVIAAKTAEPHPKLPGTIYTAAEEIKKAGGKALPCIVDVRDEESVEKCVEAAVKEFGGIDILVNNASAISLTGTLDTPMKRYDLMHNINTRGTFLMSQKALPYLKQSKNPHILNMSPPLLMEPQWFAPHVAYTMAKYGMSMCVLGMAEEFRSDGIAVNALWPRTLIWTAAADMLTGGTEEGRKGSRYPAIVADAAYAVLSRNSRESTGNFFIDDEVLKSEGVTNFDQYAIDPKADLFIDFFVPGAEYAANQRKQSKSKTSPKMSEKDLFDKIQQAITPESIKLAGAIYNFTVKSSKGDKTFHIDLKDTGKLGNGPAEKADVHFEMSEEDFIPILTGQISSMNAFVGKKLKIKGDLSKAMKLDTLIKSISKKIVS